MKKTILAAALVAFAGSAQAADLSPADAKALHDYTLSMDKIKGMQAAMDDFNAAAKADPALKKQSSDIGDQAKSFAEMEAKIKANPRMMGIYGKHGLKADDAVLMPFVLMNAGVAVAYPSAATKLSNELSPVQIAFYKQHQAELKKMPWLFGQSGE